MSLVVSLFSIGEPGQEYKWLEAVSIYFAVAFAALIQALCDWGKEKQFLRLRSEIMNEKVTVLRGQYGTSQTVMVSKLVVGDVILLSQGDRVPADCLLIEEMDMFVDQKMYYPDVAGSEMVEKQISNDNVDSDKDKNPDPILLQDSIVMRGSGKAIVLAVGEHTLKEKEIAEELETDKNALMIEKSETPYQEKLRILSEIVGIYAYMLTVLAVVVFSIVWFISCLLYTSPSPRDRQKSRMPSSA